MAQGGEDDDPIVRALERSTIAQTLKAARASLAEPSRPFTPLDRSLFQLPDGSSPSRPSSSYSVDQLHFGGGFRDFGARPDSAHSSRSSRTAGRVETIAEEGEGYSREGVADVLRLDQGGLGGSRGSRRPSPQVSSPEVPGDDSGDEGMMASGSGGIPPVPTRTPVRPPRPPSGGGYPSASANGLRTGGGYPEVPGSSHGGSEKHRSKTSASPRRSGSSSGRRSSSKGIAEGSPRRRKSSASPSPAGSPTAAGSPKSISTSVGGWDGQAEAVISKLQELADNKELRRANADLLVQLFDRLWGLVGDIQAGKGSKPQHFASKLLKQIMGLMDLKDMKEARFMLKLSRSALALLRIEGSTQGFPISGVQQAYLNIAQGLFKFSQQGDHDKDFLTEGVLVPLLEALSSAAPECASNDLRVYIVGALKNVSNDESCQRSLAENGAVAVLFSLLSADQLKGSSKEAQLLIQVTAALRNFADGQHEEFLSDERLGALTRVMALFPVHVELLTNVSRILAKLTLHASACDAFTRCSSHLKQIARTLSANPDSAPLTLRLAFVLGNLTEGSDRLRVVFAFDCEGTALVPQLLGKYWQKDRQLARIEQSQASSGLKEIEEVLVKLVRLLANIAISPDAGSTLASSSAVVDPLLDMLGAKRIGDSEELVLNVVAAVTNLLFYDMLSNLLFQEDNKQLLCRLFRPLLLESYNVEALVETARALGNLSRHQDARLCMAGLRLDEILVILLDHDDRDLVFYVCGALVNLAADPQCTSRLMSQTPVARKLGKLLVDAPPDDPALRLVGVKVLTNLSLDPSIGWAPADVQAIRGVLEVVPIDCEKAAAEAAAQGADDEGDAADRQQLIDLAAQLQQRLPASDGDPSAGGQVRLADDPVAAAAAASAPKADAPADAPKVGGGSAAETAGWVCRHEGCTRRFTSEAKMVAHYERRHGVSAA